MTTINQDATLPAVGHDTHRRVHTTERFGRWGRVMADLLS